MSSSLFSLQPLMHIADGAQKMRPRWLTACARQRNQKSYNMNMKSISIFIVATRTHWMDSRVVLDFEAPER
ncbi:hypothetical protein EB231_13415 [Mesorhizobium sp. NZP2298]|jgi:hypothetical protein|nr:hypothetical protein EB231_13415 [Mesorhizobium sp. NZP2298]